MDIKISFMLDSFSGFTLLQEYTILALTRLCVHCWTMTRGMHCSDLSGFSHMPVEATQSKVYLICFTYLHSPIKIIDLGTWDGYNDMLLISLFRVKGFISLAVRKSAGFQVCSALQKVPVVIESCLVQSHTHSLGSLHPVICAEVERPEFFAVTWDISEVPMGLSSLLRLH